jgi:hypothetical protein
MVKSMKTGKRDKDATPKTMRSSVNMDGRSLDSFHEKQ